jgi:arylsulfatase A-like enzyme
MNSAFKPEWFVGLKRAVLLVGVLACVPANIVGAESSRPPNILFILTDDLGYGELGCYGQKTIKTPRIDRFAKESTKFTHAYSGSPVCGPSRNSLLTGLHTGHTEVRGNGPNPLSANRPTLGQVMKAAGYHTDVIGKWGMGHPDTSGAPSRHGFDESFGYLDHKHAHTYFTDHLYRNEKRVELEKGSYSHDLFAAEALRFIRDNRARPFFLFLCFTIPHGPVAVPDTAPYRDEAWPDDPKKRAAMITRMDGDVGRIVDLIDELGLARDTVIFFTSDNGPGPGIDPSFFDATGGLRELKTHVYEGGIRIPMLVRWTGRTTPSINPTPWAFWDVLPTLAELGGARAPAGIDGVSVVPMLLGKPQRPHEWLYWEFYQLGYVQAARAGDWKAVRWLDKPTELYDLRTDPGEKTDVAARNRETVRKMEAIFASAHTPHPDWEKRTGRAPKQPKQPPKP